MGMGVASATEEERVNAVNVGVAGRWLDPLGSALASVEQRLLFILGTQCGEMPL